MNYTIFTSESVCSGHPDKICDQISDSIVDAALATDPKSRVAVETLVTTNKVVLAGEVTCAQKLPYQKIAREVIYKLGYTDHIFNFSHNSPISVFIHEQSPDIATGVDDGGAGDQGMMFGYAASETTELMPLPITICHQLAQKIDELRETKKLPYLYPDGKTEVKVTYKNGQPVSVDKVILAAPHARKVSREQVLDDLYKYAVKPVLSSLGFKIAKKQVVLNGTGVWHQGGPAADTGVTGRKIIVDTYGGMSRHGGGAFSGKDPTKVDRSGAYAARFLAKNIVAAKLAKRCEVQIAYVIGERQPISVDIETFGTGKRPNLYIRSFAKKLLDLSVPGIISGLNLRQPIYSKAAAYGHFGRPDFPWEKIVV
ncbi:methionine adenosyltransferase [Candidatus Microgenomates bacterium]|nr:methionine adenosyltransferase [Candidatus Microgenomates bacterium]